MDDEKVYIMDMYNRWIYPNDIKAKCKTLLSQNNANSFWV